MTLRDAYLKAKDGDQVKSKNFTYGYKKETLDTYLKKSSFYSGAFTLAHIIADDWEVINNQDGRCL